MDVTTEELAAIGDLTLTWNSVEQHLEWVIWSLAGWNDKMGIAVTTDLGNVSKVKLALNLSKNLSSESSISDVADTMNFLEICRIKRNNIIHALPISEPDQPRVLRKYSLKSGTGKIQESDTPIDIVVLQYIIQDMMRLMLALVGIEKLVLLERYCKENEPDYPLGQYRVQRESITWACIEPVRKRLATLTAERQLQEKSLVPLEFSQE